MLKNFGDKVALSGVTVLMIGITLLIFTFVSAFGFLAENLSIFATSDLTQTFGAALAPLIVTCIHIMYLGVMGWTGSIITIRGVTIIVHAPAPQITTPSATSATASTLTNNHKEQKRTSEKTPEKAPEKLPPKAEEELKKLQPGVKTQPSEPQFIMIPPDNMLASPPSPQESSPQQTQKTEEKPQNPSAS
jgi:hypothetical protein